MEKKITLGEDRQVFYNFAIPGSLFISVALILGAILYSVHDALPESISFSGAVLIALASWRMTRGITYDKLLAFVREKFKYDKMYVKENGQVMVVKKEARAGTIKRAISETLECPWCTGFWMTLFATFLYYIAPQAYILLLILALSAVASFCQLVANLVAATYERFEK